MSRLAAHRIRLLPIREIEDFVRSFAGDGTGWLSDALKNRLHESPATDGARQFSTAF